MTGTVRDRPGNGVGRAAQARLLDLDPDLGRLLPPDRGATARSGLLVRVHPLAAGPWAAEELVATDPHHLGLLLVEGIVVREIVLADTVSCELLGPGDVIRPWQVTPPDQLLRATVRWAVLEAGRLAALDRRLAHELTQYPEVYAMLVDRTTERTQRLALSQAISQLNGVDRRLLALLWHLAERWGRVAQDGIHVPVPLSHRVLAQLVGARRPTVSTALGTLAEQGEVERREDGGWILHGEPVGVPTEEAARVVRARHRRFEREATPDEPAPAPEPEPPTDRAELHASVERARAASRRTSAEYRTLHDETTALLERLTAARAQRRES